MSAETDENHGTIFEKNYLLISYVTPISAVLFKIYLYATTEKLVYLQEQGLTSFSVATNSNYSII
jgi:hypothetical protein